MRGSVRGGQPVGVSPRLARAYRQTHYEAPGFSVRIGRHASAWPFAVREVVLIGAANPAGRRLAGGLNARRTAALVRRVRERAWLAGEGRLGNWAETFLVVAIPHAQGAVLARRFGQNALVLVRRGQRARLIWLV